MTAKKTNPETKKTANPKAAKTTSKAAKPASAAPNKPLGSKKISDLDKPYSFDAFKLNYASQLSFTGIRVLANQVWERWARTNTMTADELFAYPFVKVLADYEDPKPATQVVTETVLKEVKVNRYYLPKLDWPDRLVYLFTGKFSEYMNVTLYTGDPCNLFTLND